MNRDRNDFYYRLFRLPVILFLRLFFGYRYVAAPDLPYNYIVVSNHVTDFDPLFVAASFARPMHFVASEHVARWGRFSEFLSYAFNPIYHKKGAVGLRTIVEVLKRLKAGNNVCVFAEGVRSWDGRTGPIDPSIAGLIRRAGCGLVTYRIIGGYFVSPGWSDGNLRRGEVQGGPVQAYSPEEIAAMTTEDLINHVRRDLSENAYSTQEAAPKRYVGKNLAENLENLLFICPSCGAHDAFTTKDDTVTCSACGKSFCYNEYGYLEGTDFRTVLAFSDWQNEAVDRDVVEHVVYTAKEASVSRIEEHQEKLVAEGPLTMTPEGLSCGDLTIPMGRISMMAIHGRHALVFTAGKEYYELLPRRTNAIRFLLYYRACRARAGKKSMRM